MGPKTSKQKSNQNNTDISSTQSVRVFLYKELKKATNDFSAGNIVGKGGFGSVYKGILNDGTAVAVKVLSQESKQGTREFISELTVVTGIVHENLVTLYGCCVEGTQRILVYNYLENNSVAQTLLGSKRSNIQFSWKTRAKIIIGIARGLEFLHDHVQPHIVHRDIKASNILLDSDLTPKISDFGLAKLLPLDTSYVSTRVAGTIGYLAPEYAARGQVTRKSDVYSFGVLLLEIVTGRSNADTRLPYEEQLFLDYSPDAAHGLIILQTWALYESGDLSRIVDTSITDTSDLNEACKFLKIGLLCTQEASKLRPYMPKVLKLLEGEIDVESEKITKPGVISNFMELKLRGQSTPTDKGNKDSSLSASSGSTSSSRATMTYTTLSNRE